MIAGLWERGSLGRVGGLHSSQHGVERRLERVEKGLDELSTATALGRRR